MARFRKKPVVIDAVRTSTVMSAAMSDWGKVPDWFRDAYKQRRVILQPTGVSIPTLEGEMFAGIHDWIIRGVQGELYPCKPDIFDATYEPVDA